MTHITEEQLILYFYGESDDSPGIAGHLAGCPACREDLAVIQRTLNLVDGMDIPERGAAYGEQMWQALSPRIRPRMRFWPGWLQPRQLGACAAIASLVIVAYLAGRGTAPVPLSATRDIAEQGQAVRSRVLVVNVSDHLERSKLFLIELANREPGSLKQDQPRAEDLLSANRLYRLSARRDSEGGVAEMLDELEQILTEVSNAGPGELGAIQRRMAQQDLLFKIRVMDSQMRQKQRKPIDISSN